MYLGNGADTAMHAKCRVELRETQGVVSVRNYIAVGRSSDVHINKRRARYSENYISKLRKEVRYRNIQPWNMLVNNTCLPKKNHETPQGIDPP